MRTIAIPMKSRDHVADALEHNADTTKAKASIAQVGDLVRHLQNDGSGFVRVLLPVALADKCATAFPAGANAASFFTTDAPRLPTGGIPAVESKQKIARHHGSNGAGRNVPAESKCADAAWCLSDTTPEREESSDSVNRAIPMTKLHVGRRAMTELNDNLSFYDWCAAAWLRIYRRYGLDDPGFGDGRLPIWRQAWQDGEEPDVFADSFAEEGCDLDSLEGWNGPYMTGEPSQKVPFSASAFEDRETPAA
jgi:hypothetical protein